MLFSFTYVTGQTDLCSRSLLDGDLRLSSDVIRGHSNKNSAVGEHILVKVISARFPDQCAAKVNRSELLRETLRAKMHYGSTQRSLVRLRRC